jgi:hypothetical protein
MGAKIQLEGVVSEEFWAEMESSRLKNLLLFIFGVPIR